MVKVIKVKLNDLATAEVLVEPGDYLASFDLENQFNHVRLAQEFKKYFGSALSTEEFNTFTIPSMAWGFCACCKCGPEVVAAIEGSSIELGNQAVMVVDDRRIAAPSEKETGGATGPGARGYSELRMKRAVALDFYISRAEAPLVFLVFYADTLHMCIRGIFTMCRSSKSWRNCGHHDK
jgi:hypothetical protein